MKADGTQMTAAAALDATSATTEDARMTAAAAEATDEADEAACWVCYGGEEVGALISPCACRGSVRFIHRACLRQWLTSSMGDSHHAAQRRCPQCREAYTVNSTRAKAATSTGTSGDARGGGDGAVDEDPSLPWLLLHASRDELGAALTAIGIPLWTCLFYLGTAVYLAYRVADFWATVAAASSAADAAASGGVAWRLLGVGAKLRLALAYAAGYACEEWGLGASALRLPVPPLVAFGSVVDVPGNGSVSLTGSLSQEMVAWWADHGPGAHWSAVFVACTSVVTRFGAMPVLITFFEGGNRGAGAPDDETEDGLAEGLAGGVGAPPVLDVLLDPALPWDREVAAATAWDQHRQQVAAAAAGASGAPRAPAPGFARAAEALLPPGAVGVVAEAAAGAAEAVDDKWGMSPAAEAALLVRRALRKVALVVVHEAHRRRAARTAAAAAAAAVNAGGAAAAAAAAAGTAASDDDGGADSVEFFEAVVALGAVARRVLWHLAPCLPAWLLPLLLVRNACVACVLPWMRRPLPLLHDAVFEATFTLCSARVVVGVCLVAFAAAGLASWPAVAKAWRRTRSHLLLHHHLA